MKGPAKNRWFFYNVIWLGFDFMRTTIMNQVRLFEIMKTTVINLNNHPNYKWGFGANSSTCPTLV